MHATRKQGQPLKGAAAGLLMVLLAACSNSAASSAPTAAPAASQAGAPAAQSATPAEPVTIHWLTHNPSETAASEQAAMDWVTQYQNEHPGITIEREEPLG